VFQAVEQHRQALSGGDGEALKRSPETNVTLVRLDGFLPNLVCVKEFRSRGLGYALKDLVRPSPVLRSWRAGRLMEDLGFGAPRVLAAVLAPCCRPGLSSFLLMEAITDAVRLDRFAQERFAAAGTGQRREWLGLVARHLRRMHDAGMYHRDMKAGNVLVRERDGKIEVVLVDLGDIRGPQPVSRRLRLRNLAQIHASLPRAVAWTERLRFFRFYNAEPAVLAREREAISVVERLARRRKRNWGEP
jgi:serine/threonine protein kinase